MAATELACNAQVAMVAAIESGEGANDILVDIWRVEWILITCKSPAWPKATLCRPDHETGKWWIHGENRGAACQVY